MIVDKADFNKEKFIKRLMHLYFIELDEMKNFCDTVDYLICVNTEETRVWMNKSSALMYWLFELSLPDMIIVFGKEWIYFVSNQRNIQILMNLLDNATFLKTNNAHSLSIQFFKISDDEDYQSSFIKVIDIMKNKSKYGKIGLFKDGSSNSKFAKAWVDILETSSFTLIDMNLYGATVMSVKDEQELEYMEKAFYYAGCLFGNSLRSISLLVNKAKNQRMLSFMNPSNNNVEHSQANVLQMQLRNIDVATGIDTEFMQRINIYEEPINAIKFCFPSIIQSGGFYNLNLNSISDNNYFREDIIILCLGIRYKQYCSTLIRTAMVTPTQNIQLRKNFELLQQIHEFVIFNLRNNVELGRLYQDAVNFVENTNPEMIKHLTKHFGSIIGIECEDEYFVIEANCKQIAKENMIFNVKTGFLSIYDPTMIKQPPHTYCLWMGDCVKVRKGDRAKPLKVVHNGISLLMQKVRDIDPDV